MERAQKWLRATYITQLYFEWLGGGVRSLSNVNRTQVRGTAVHETDSIYNQHPSSWQSFLQSHIQKSKSVQRTLEGGWGCQSPWRTRILEALRAYRLDSGVTLR